MTRPKTLGRILREALFRRPGLHVGRRSRRRAASTARSLRRPPTSARASSTPAKQNKVSKIDLLFMIDNSSSMADKQAHPGAGRSRPGEPPGRPGLHRPDDRPSVGNANANGSCATGEPDFDPVKDIHIGIISSSLGGHGSTGVCDEPDPRKTLPHNDDHGHLVARDAMDAAVRRSATRASSTGTRRERRGPDAAAIATPFATMVAGVGQHGCGYEASLEAIYRFLIEPDPVRRRITVDRAPAAARRRGARRHRHGPAPAARRLPAPRLAGRGHHGDRRERLLDRRRRSGLLLDHPAPAARPPTSVLAHGTSACMTNPNDPCCFNCFSSRRPPRAARPRLTTPSASRRRGLATEDPENLRCCDQKRRYGVDFLYPVQALHRRLHAATIVPDRTGKAVKNPLYDDLTPVRRRNGLCGRARQEPGLRGRHRRRPLAGHRASTRTTSPRAT